MPDQDRMNPQVRDLEIGIRSLRKIKIYPMSMADQLSLNDLITQTITAFFATKASEGEQGLIAFVTFMLDLIRENMGRFVGYTTDEKDPDVFLGDITNEQAILLAEIIYEQNYVGLIKKVKALFQKMGESKLLMEEPLQRVVRSTVTRSETSTESPSEKAE